LIFYLIGDFYESVGGYHFFGRKGRGGTLILTEDPLCSTGVKLYVRIRVCCLGSHKGMMCINMVEREREIYSSFPRNKDIVLEITHL
jgi:hypothetical protein